MRLNIQRPLWVIRNRAIQRQFRPMSGMHLKAENKISALVSAAMSERRLPVTGQVSERLTRELAAMKGGPLWGVYS
jgi:hypothetical protein